MPPIDQTLDDQSRSADPGAADPGVVIIFSGRAPRLAAVTVERSVVLGRGGVGDVALADDHLSREHARFDRRGDGIVVRDVGSRNGTWVDGERITGTTACAPGTIVRAGHTVALVVADIDRFAGFDEAELAGADIIAGPTTRRALAHVGTLASTADTLLITGESGAGKEIAARAFHAATGRPGPLVPVNCAAVPEGVAERLLFGSRKGAFSGAVDGVGSIEAASGGTLFLDELGELPLPIQAKLLRALENREVTPLGATRPVAVDVRVCAATNRDLRAEVTAGRFREDLYFRLGAPELRMPPLRERREEIGFLARQLLGELGLELDGKLMEAMCLRMWPGNVRELRNELRRAAATARTEGDTTVGRRHLAESAGRAFEPPTTTTPATEPVRRVPEEVTSAEIDAAMAAHDGNVSAAARALGLHRTQLYRLLARLKEQRSSE